MPKTKKALVVNAADFAPSGPLSVEPLQHDEGASIAICHPERGVIATIPPTNDDQDPDFDTATREHWDLPYAALFAAAPAMYSTLAKMRSELNCVCRLNALAERFGAGIECTACVIDAVLRTAETVDPRTYPARK